MTPTNTKQIRMTDEIRSRIAKLYAEGKPIRTVADMTGAGYGTVWKYLNEKGMLRTRGGMRGKKQEGQ